MATVELSRPLDANGGKLTVRFDVRDVVEGSQEAFGEEEEALEDEEETEMSEENAAEEEDGDFMDEAHMFPLELEIQHGTKRLLLQAEYSVEVAEQPLVVTNALLLDDAASKANVDAGESVYEGPQYHQLDPELRSRMDAYANRLLSGDMLQFISEYGLSKEATQYGKWLEDVKSVVAAAN